MKAKMMRIMAVAIVAAMVFSTASAYAGESWGGKKNEGDMKKHFDKMAEELNLTAEQKAVLEKQREETAPKVKAIKERQRAAHEQLRAELNKETPDKATLDAIIQELKNLAGEQVQVRIDGILTMKKVLTPEQSAKMKSMMEERRKESKGKRGDKSDKEHPHDDF